MQKDYRQYTNGKEVKTLQMVEDMCNHSKGRYEMTEHLVDVNGNMLLVSMTVKDNETGIKDEWGIYHD